MQGCNDPSLFTAETRRRGADRAKRIHYLVNSGFKPAALKKNSASPRLRGEIAKGLLGLYTGLISPFLGQGKCRYYPTCSAYALEALDQHGLVRGSWLALLRILSCHAYSRRPFHDPVPQAITPVSSATETTENK